MSDEDQAAFEKAMEEYTSQFVACFISRKQSLVFWNAACTYKDKRIAELEGGLQEIIDHAYENGSHARTMRKIALGTLRGRRG